MAKPEKHPAPQSAVAIVKGEERKYYVLVLSLVGGKVTGAKTVETTIWRDLAEDAARRALRGLR